MQIAKRTDLSIGSIDFFPIAPKRGLLGFVRLTINDSFRLGNIAVYQRLDGSGIRLVFPAKKLVTGATVDSVRPLSREVGDELTKAVAEHIANLRERRTSTEQARTTRREGIENAQLARCRA